MTGDRIFPALDMLAITRGGGGGYDVECPDCGKWVKLVLPGEPTDVWVTTLPLRAAGARSRSPLWSTPAAPQRAAPVCRRGHETSARRSVRSHGSLHGMTPAMALGICDSFWPIDRLDRLTPLR